MRARTEDPSDADPQIATEMAAAQARWPEAITIDTASAYDPAEHAIAAIRPHRPARCRLVMREKQSKPRAG